MSVIEVADRSRDNWHVDAERFTNLTFCNICKVCC